MSDLADDKATAKEFVDDCFAEYTKTFVVQELARVSDGQGGFTKSWSDFATITGFAKVVTGKEIINNDRIKSAYATKFSFEHVDGLENDMRISYNGEIYNIVSIAPIMESTVWTNIIADRAVAT